MNDCPWDEDSACALLAAYGGHLEVLKWARENGCSWDEDTCARAARWGYLEVLKWARENGCPWDKSTCADSVVEGGHLEVLQWARMNGCSWDEKTCEMAAKNSELEVLQWALENGCKWKESHLFAEKWPPHLFPWLHENTQVLVHADGRYDADGSDDHAIGNGDRSNDGDSDIPQ